MGADRDLTLLVLPVAVAAIVFSAAVHAADVGSGGMFHDGLQGKIEYCQDCHGASARGYRGFYPIPRLAGQTTEYIVNQLRAFVEGRRETHIPIKMARVHGVNPALRAALAAHFHELNPRPIDDAPRGLVAEGKKIYEEGAPNFECSGLRCLSRARSQRRRRGAIPRLAGQLLSLHGERALRMGRRARSGFIKARHIKDDGHDRAKYDEVANCGRRSLREQSEMIRTAWAIP